MKSFPVPVIVIAIVAMLMTGCRDEMPPQEIVRTVRSMKVADFAGMTKRTFPGRAKATQEVDLAFRVAGPLVAFPVKVGDEVEEGDLIARIDPREEQQDLTEMTSIEGDEPFILHPGEFVLGQTVEWVELPDDLVARLEGKSSLGRLGLMRRDDGGRDGPPEIVEERLDSLAGLECAAAHTNSFRSSERIRLFVST